MMHSSFSSLAFSFSFSFLTWDDFSSDHILANWSVHSWMSSSPLSKNQRWIGIQVLISQRKHSCSSMFHTEKAPLPAKYSSSNVLQLKKVQRFSYILLPQVLDKTRYSQLFLAIREESSIKNSRITIVANKFFWLVRYRILNWSTRIIKFCQVKHF